jgi:hypothetical protein
LGIDRVQQLVDVGPLDFVYLPAPKRLVYQSFKVRTPHLNGAQLPALAGEVVLGDAPQLLVPNRDLNLDPHQLNFGFHSVLGLLAIVAPFFILFSTARRKNGFAGLHDLASDTRVIRKQSVEARPASLLAADASAETEMLPKVGPYHVLAILNKTESHELLIGYDTRLLRKVWIRKVPLGTPPLLPRRHSTSVRRPLTSRSRSKSRYISRSKTSTPVMATSRQEICLHSIHPRPPKG